ncbi:MAG: tetratricopeptide repeat protein [Candidatus Omnitrophota bacterium]
MLCPHCGHKNEEGIRFCTGCGELLGKRARGRPAERPTAGTSTTRTPVWIQSIIGKGLLLVLAVIVIFVLISITLAVHRASHRPAPPVIHYSSSPLPSPAPPRESVQVPEPAVSKPSPPSPQTNAVEKEPVAPPEKEKVVEKSVFVDQNLDRFINLPAKTEEEFKKFKQDEGWRLIQTIGLNIQFDQLCRKAEDANKRHEWQEVINLYGKALQTYPQYYDASFRMANSYNQLNQPDKALEWTLKGLQKFRCNLLYEIAAEAYSRKGDESRMLTWLEGAFKGGFKASKEDMDRAFSRHKDDPRYLSLLQKYKI